MTEPTKKKCPICGSPSEVSYRPFCSKRCADVDLMHWLKGDYRLPAEDDVVPQDDEAGDTH